MAIETVATTALPTATALADADAVLLNQGGASKRGVMTLISDYIATKLFGAYTTYVPTVAGSTPAGADFAYTITDARYKKIGRRVEVILSFAVTDVGSGPSATGTVNVTAPVAAAYRSSLGHGKEFGATNKGLLPSISASTSTIVISLSDASGVAMAAGRSYSVGIIYEAAS
jgi:hypothetical protein